ncbi:hypothetical protein J2801_003555 [Paraburkholderia phenoliruptrix]|uniref:hypothetical protein n=1 Tax=Paraburkholderia phenoliruptrix TaxID=252970 RepID=UPI002861ED07|nr:hypothetical protein [Paraburkholderia phenoliruptrix]MDR6421267.1 hypothetical protein [Paraburkholderia phenoliruptrix]
MPETYPPGFFTHENLLRLSHDHLLIVVFLKSRSEAFALADDVARHAPLFSERDLESLKIHIAGFSATFDGANAAMRLIHYVRGWRGTHFYAQGRMVIGDTEAAFQIEAVLKCFADSCAARDYRAHCFRLIDDPFSHSSSYRNLDHIAPYFRVHQVESTGGSYVFPCRHMLQWFRAQKSHPAKVADQIQAEGVQRYCDLCPRFEPNDFGFTSMHNKEKK